MAQTENISTITESSLGQHWPKMSSLHMMKTHDFEIKPANSGLKFNGKTTIEKTEEKCLLDRYEERIYKLRKLMS